MGCWTRLIGDGAKELEIVNLSLDESEMGALIFQDDRWKQIWMDFYFFFLLDIMDDNLYIFDYLELFEWKLLVLSMEYIIFKII